MFKDPAWARERTGLLLLLYIYHIETLMDALEKIGRSTQSVIVRFSASVAWGSLDSTCDMLETAVRLFISDAGIKQLERSASFFEQDV